jgi:beta propeller repeat protein
MWIAMGKKDVCIVISAAFFFLGAPVLAILMEYSASLIFLAIGLILYSFRISKGIVVMGMGLIVMSYYFEYGDIALYLAIAFIVVGSCFTFYEFWRLKGKIRQIFIDKFHPQDNEKIKVSYLIGPRSYSLPENYYASCYIQLNIPVAINTGKEDYLYLYDSSKKDLLRTGEIIGDIPLLGMVIGVIFLVPSLFFITSSVDYRLNLMGFISAFNGSLWIFSFFKEKLRKNKMNLYKLMIFSVILSIFFSVSTQCSYEFQITDDTHVQINAAIYGDIVVWMDLNGKLRDDSDIYGYNLSTGETFPICTEKDDQGFPDIWGDIVVWEDHRNRSFGGYIYGYTLSTGEEFKITKDWENHGSPVIQGDIVVWEDERNGNWDIYGCNLSTGEEFEVISAELMQIHPALYGDIVVWVDRRDKDCLYGRNLSTSTIFKITTGVGHVDLPAIYKDIIVWMDLRNGNGNIYGYYIPPSILSSEEQSIEIIESDAPIEEETENSACVGTSFLLVILFGGVLTSVIKKYRGMKIDQ